MLSIVADQVRSTLISRVGAGFTVIADETRDASNREQLCVAVRYLCAQTHAIEERFIAFISVPSVRGKLIVPMSV